MAYQTYYDGDFWYCKAAASAGQSPATHPAKFERILIPYQLRGPVASIAAARLFAQEDNLEQSAGAEQLGRRKLEEELLNSYLAPKAGPGIQATRT